MENASCSAKDCVGSTLKNYNVKHYVVNRIERKHDTGFPLNPQSMHKVNVWSRLKTQ